jgi:hypothetical protein
MYAKPVEWRENSWRGGISVRCVGIIPGKAIKYSQKDGNNFAKNPC